MTSSNFGAKGLAAALAVAGSLTLGLGQANAALTIVINNLNAGSGIGFDDPTPATPVGGNTGTTLGEQRLIAFSYAANLWGAALTSSQPVVINAQFSALTCTATTAVLGSAGATSIFRNFAGAPKADTWYSYALANKIAGSYQGTANAAQINANFNVNLGRNANCLPTSTWYYGLDSNEPAGGIDFVAVLQHEMAHGLGFQTFTNGTTGAFNGGFPAIWDHYLFGTVTGLAWKDMTAAQRVASAISLDKLVWTGPNVTAAVPQVLRFGLSGVTISGGGAGAAAGVYRAGDASFGPALSNTAVSGEVMPVAEQTAGAGEGCETFNAANTAAVSGRVALISRGICGFAIKVKNAQNAGAKAVIIQDNAVENAAAPAGLGGSDPTITIPAVRMFLVDGAKIREALKKRSRTGSGIFAALGLVVPQYAGANPQGQALMFAPNPFQSGSSVSHFDTSMFRNQLMEPSINGDLTQSVIPPIDMTLPLFLDIGW